MGYKISRPRRHLVESFSTIAKTLRQVEFKRTSPAVRDYVIAAGIVLAHAEIENYISDSIDAFARTLASTSRKGSELPPLLRAHLFIHKTSAKSIIGKLLTGRGEKESLDAFAHAISGPAGTLINDAGSLTTISGNDIYTVCKYPSKDNIRKVLQRLGVQDPIAQLSQAIRKDAIALLESLGSLRTQVSHSVGVLPGVTPRDVRDRLEGGKKFVQAFDRVLYTVTVSHFGIEAWKSIATSGDNNS